MKKILLLILIILFLSAPNFVFADFSDNFNDNSFDTAKWAETDSGSNVAETNNQIEMTGDGAWNHNGIRSAVVVAHYYDSIVATFDITTPATLVDFFAGFTSSNTLGYVSTQQIFIEVNSTYSKVVILCKGTGAATKIALTSFPISTSTTYNCKLSIYGSESAKVEIKKATDAEYTVIYTFAQNFTGNIYFQAQVNGAQKCILDNVSVTTTDLSDGYIGGFDGSGGYANLTGVHNLSIPTTGSVSFFFRPSTWGAYDDVICNNPRSAGNARAFRFEEFAGNGTTAAFYTATDAGANVAYLSSTTSFSTGVLYFICFTWNTSTNHRQLFVNGISEAEATSSFGFPSVFYNFCAGDGITNDNARDFAGNIYDVAIHNSEVSTSNQAAMIAGTYGYSTAIYLWHFNETAWIGTSNEIVDSIEGKNGVRVGNATTFPKIIPHTWAYSFIHIGDSLAADGRIGSGIIGTWDTSLTYLNKGVSGQTTTQMLARFNTDTITTNGNKVYLTGGTNDYYFDPAIPIATTVSNIDSMYGLCIAADPDREIIIGEVPPMTDREPLSGLTNEEMQDWTKRMNAEIREWCVNASIKMCPSYQSMTYNDVSHEDDIAASYDADGVHFTAAGYAKMAGLYWKAEIPTRSYRWGISIDGITDEGWGWWIKNGTASVSGDPNTGELVLPQNQTADSPVKCLPAGLDNPIVINIPTGTTVSYRTSSANFNRDAATDWTTYTIPFVPDGQFIQIRLTGNSVSDVSVNDFSYSWEVVNSSSAVLCFF